MKSHKAGFPPFPHSLEIPSGFPHSNGLYGWICDSSYALNTSRHHRRGLVTDVSSPQGNSCPGALTPYAAVKESVRLENLFANADVMEFASLGAFTEEHFNKISGVNGMGILFTVQKALPLLNDGGSIIINGSVASSKGTSWFGVYGGSKAAIRSVVRTLTVELKDCGIRSNVISPGPTETPLVAGVPPEKAAQIISTIPMGRMAG